MYVAAHPLDGTEHILAAHRNTTISDLLASGRAEGTVRLAGLITSVQNKVTKQGNAWAIVNLADRDGTIEALERNGAAPVQLAFPYPRVNEPMVRKLRRIMGAHPGESPVHLFVRGPQKTTVYLLRSKVNAATIASDTKGSFGQDTWHGVA